jgi:hypothetical protein
VPPPPPPQARLSRVVGIVVFSPIMLVCARPGALARPARSALHLAGPTSRMLATGGPAKRETLLEKNERLREASEANLEKSRQTLISDVGTRNQEMGSLREVIREKAVTLHPPPAALYSQAKAFRFPELTAQSLLGGDVSISSQGDGLFATGKWTVLGCAGSNFSQPMVDGWLESLAPLLPDSAAAPAAAAAERASASAADEGSPSREDGAEAASAASLLPLQVRWLSFVEGRVLSWIARPLMMSMRASVPRERHERFLCHFAVDTVEVRKVLLMQNRYLGYVCLVDPQGVVRWHVHGNELPSEQEASRFRALVRKSCARVA